MCTLITLTMNKFNFRILLVVFIVCCGVIKHASAQNNLQNLSTINVDELSDDKIKQMMQQAQSAGMSDAELIQQAQNRGMPDAQIQKLQARVNLLRKNGGSKSTLTDSASSNKRQLNYKTDSLDSSSPNSASDGTGPKIFGR